MWLETIDPRCIEETACPENVWFLSYGVIIDNSGMIRVLDHRKELKNGSMDFSDFLHAVRGH